MDRELQTLQSLARAAFAIVYLWLPAAGLAEEKPSPDVGNPAEESLEEADGAAKNDELLGHASVGVEEIVITGEILEGVSQDDSVSAVGFDQSELTVEGISDIRDLAPFTPNLEIKTAFAAVNPTLFIRGVGLDDFNANSASAVSVYQDGVYMNSPAGQLFGLYDVDGVEVLRGPQPTLTNASAGAILVRSHLPSDEWEAYLTSTFGNYNLKEFQGAVNVPIVPDWLRVRGAFKLRQRDGVTLNACKAVVDAGLSIAEMGQCAQASGQTRIGGQVEPPTSLKKWVNNVDNWAARGLASATMPLFGEGSVDWLLQVNGGQNRSLATQYQHTGLRLLRNSDGSQTYLSTLPSGQPALDAYNYAQERTQNSHFAGEYDRIGPENLDLFGASLKGTWEPRDTLHVETLTAYAWHDRATYANDDGGPKIWLDDDYTDKAWQVNQETSVSWAWGEEGESVLGASFLYEDLTGQNVIRDNQNKGSTPAFSQSIDQKTTQWGIYGTTHVDLPPLPSWGEFVENFFIDGSLRYNWAKKDFGVESIAISGLGEEFPSLTGSDSGQWSAWTGAASLTYRITDDKNLYAKYSRGWKPGHFNAGTLFSSQSVSPVQPETVDSIELGLRTEWFDGRLRANLTAFKYRYDNLQVFQLATDSKGLVLRRLINAQRADIKGLEWELWAAPIEGLVLGFNGAYLDSAYTKFSTSFERVVINPGEGPKQIVVDEDYSGNRLIASPTWSWNGSVEYTIPLLHYGSVTPRFSFTYKDDTFFDPNEGRGAEGTLVERLGAQPAYWLFNAGITYTSPGGRVEVTGFVRNFLDEEYKIQSFDLSNRRHLVLDVYGEPRMVGAIITLRY